MLGVPDSDRDKFAYWSDTLLNLTRYTQAEVEASQAEFSTYMQAHITAKRAEPGEDLLSELITADRRRRRPDARRGPAWPPVRACLSPGTRPPPT